MKIVFFTESYKPYISGVTVSLENLANSLTRLGHRVWIVAPDYPGRPRVLSKIIRLPSIPCRRYSGFRVALPFSFGLLKKLETISPDIIHTHSPYSLGLLAKIYARRLKIPLVYTFHTVFSDYLHYFPLLPPRLADRLLSGYFRWFLKNTPTVVPTDFCLSLVRPLTSARTTVIPSGIDLRKVALSKKTDLRKELSLKPDTKILLYVGRLSREKNIPFLLDALKIILKQGGSAHLVLIASGPEEKNLRQQVARNVLQNQVSFFSQIPNERIFGYYLAADIFVCSSKSETQGLVLVEAMAAGKPLVAIDAKGVSDIIIPGTGFLTAENPSEFAGRVRELMDNQELRQIMGNNALVLAREKYSAPVSAGKMEKFYRELIYI